MIAAAGMFYGYRKLACDGSVTQVYVLAAGATGRSPLSLQYSAPGDELFILYPYERVPEYLEGLRAGNHVPAVDNEGRGAVDAAAVRFVGDRGESAAEPALVKRLLEPGRIDPRRQGCFPHGFPGADIAGPGKVPVENSLVIGLERAAFFGEFARFERQARIGQNPNVAKRDAVPLAGPAQVPVQAVPVDVGQTHLEQHALRRGLRVYFKGEPLVNNREFFFQLVDNALADIAEWSYII